MKYNSYQDINKKQRGQRRKLELLFKYIDTFKAFESTNDAYEHFHVPGDNFIEYIKTTSKVKTAFCKKWIDTTLRFISEKPTELEFCKVVALISVPNYWSSQIIIFYDEDYYSEFWNRDDDYQRWESIDGKYSFTKERGIHTLLLEKGYKEIICEEDFV